MVDFMLKPDSDHINFILFASDFAISKRIFIFAVELRGN